jgi:hypothetical protein
MRTSTLDGARTRPTPPVRARRHHRSTIVVATGVLTLLAVTVGAAVALADRRSTATPAVPAIASATTAGPAVVSPGPTAATPATAAAPRSGATPRQAAADASPASPAAAPRPVLADGTYPAFIRKVDPDRRTMVVDVIQVFEGKAALQAAVQDGRGSAGTWYPDPYIRNQSSRLRTLPVARVASIKFFNTCEGPTATRAVLSVLAKNATTSKAYYYSLTVAGGSVRRIVEHQAIPAC